jgi:SHS2 domain-containing protein
MSCRLRIHRNGDDLAASCRWYPVRVSTPERGRREVEHTADWELEVWGPDLAALVEEAALGMYELMGLEISDESRRYHRLEIRADDPEQLLVSFLEELLFLADTDDLAFDGFLLDIVGTQMIAHLEGGFIISRRKEIKAVTYHRLDVKQSGSGLRTNVIFDV